MESGPPLRATATRSAGCRPQLRTAAMKRDSRDVIGRWLACLGALLAYGSAAAGVLRPGLRHASEHGQAGTARQVKGGGASSGGGQQAAEAAELGAQIDASRRSSSST